LIAIVTFKKTLVKSKTQVIIMNKKFWTSLILVLVVGTAFTLIFKQKAAQAAPSGYEIGATVADFSLKGVDGNKITLSNFKDKKGLIVVFMSNHCPFSKAYEDRIMALDKKFAALGYPVLGVNSNDPDAYEEDSFDNIKARSKEKAYTFGYGADETQGVARAFGASKTPQVFVLKNDGGKFTLQYIGSIDDSAQDPASVSKRYVEEAITNLLGGKPVVTTITKAVGCGIKFKEA
jgi:glutathione peroxidase-family protein